MVWHYNFVWAAAVAISSNFPSLTNFPLKLIWHNIWNGALHLVYSLFIIFVFINLEPKASFSMISPKFSFFLTCMNMVSGICLWSSKICLHGIPFLVSSSFTIAIYDFLQGIKGRGWCLFICFTYYLPSVVPNKCLP